MFLTRISVNHPVFATMIMVAIMVFGVYSYQRLPIEQLPDVDFPVVAVVVSYPGASPEAVETDIIEPLEEAVNTIAGLDTIQSTAQAGPVPQRQVWFVQVLLLPVQSALVQQVPATQSPPQQRPSPLPAVWHAVRSGTGAYWQICAGVVQTPVWQVRSSHGPQLTGLPQLLMTTPQRAD